MLISKQQIFETVARRQRQHDDRFHLVVGHHPSTDLAVIQTPSMQSLRQLRLRVYRRLQQLHAATSDGATQARTRRRFPGYCRPIRAADVVAPSYANKCCLCIVWWLSLKNVKGTHCSHRSTVNRIVTLNALVQTRRGFNKLINHRGSHIYVDLKSSFDSVDRESLWLLLRRHGIPNKR